MEVKFCESALLMKNHEIFRFYRICLDIPDKSQIPFENKNLEM